jgi:hypothetical protein
MRTGETAAAERTDGAAGGLGRSVVAWDSFDGSEARRAVTTRTRYRYVVAGRRPVST